MIMDKVGLPIDDYRGVRDRADCAAGSGRAELLRYWTRYGQNSLPAMRSRRSVRRRPWRDGYGAAGKATERARSRGDSRVKFGEAQSLGGHAKKLKDREDVAKAVAEVRGWVVAHGLTISDACRRVAGRKGNAWANLRRRYTATFPKQK